MNEDEEEEPEHYCIPILREVLIYHQQRSDTSCHCGWKVLGESHADHVISVFLDSLGYYMEKMEEKED